jgi:primosomal protein N'
MQKLNKKQKDAVEKLLSSDRVDQYHKTLLKGIKGNNFKNVSIADNQVLVDLINRYELRGVFA